MSSQKNKSQKSRPLSCDVCEENFSNRHDMVLHMSRHFSFQKDHEVKSVDSKTDARIISVYKNVKCSKCPMVFQSIPAVRIHQASHDADDVELLFECDICSRQFSSMVSLSHHKKSHTYKGMYSCEHCDAQFNNIRCLKEHEKNHSKKIKKQKLKQQRSDIQNNSANQFVARSACHVSEIPIRSVNSSTNSSTKDGIASDYEQAHIREMIQTTEDDNSQERGSDIQQKTANHLVERSDIRYVKVDVDESTVSEIPIHSIISSVTGSTRGHSSDMTVNCNISDIEQLENDDLAVNYNISDLEQRFEDDGSPDLTQENRQSQDTLISDSVIEEQSFSESKDDNKITEKEYKESSSNDDSDDETLDSDFEMESNDIVNITSRSGRCIRKPQRLEQPIYSRLNGPKRRKKLLVEELNDETHTPHKHMKSEVKQKSQSAMNKSLQSNNPTTPIAVVSGLQSNNPTTPIAVVSDKEIYSEIQKYRKGIRTKDELKLQKDINNEGFRCDICGQILVSLHGHIRHIRSYHSNTDVSCATCGKKFKDLKFLEKHIKVHGVSRSFICDVCGMSLDTHARLWEHEKSHVTELLFNCQGCDRRFNCQSVLDRHKHQTEYQEATACYYCDEVFHDRCERKKHMTLSHAGRRPGNRKIKCGKCGKQIVITGYNHHIMKMCGVYDDCDVCGKSIPRRSFTRHKLFSHPDTSKEYPCKICDKTFLSEIGLRGHMNFSSGHSQNVCQICGAVFESGPRYVLHVKSHESDTSCECDICGKKFNNVLSMKLHQRMAHKSNQEAKTCEMCGRTFKDRVTLSAHHRFYHKLNNSDNTSHEEFKCDDCGKIFHVKRHLNGHMATMHTVIKLTCSTCKENCENKKELKAHCKSTGHKLEWKCNECGWVTTSLPKLKRHARVHPQPQTT